MSKKILIAFSKYDQYNNAVFQASISDPGYDELKTLAGKISTMKFTNTFSPIYYSPEFEICTIRFKPSDINMKFTKHSTYDISYSIKKIERNTKTYINCLIRSIKLVKKHIVIDETEDLFMD
jgi:hypothetical protein